MAVSEGSVPSVGSGSDLRTYLACITCSFASLSCLCESYVPLFCRYKRCVMSWPLMKSNNQVKMIFSVFTWLGWAIFIFCWLRYITRHGSDLSYLPYLSVSFCCVVRLRDALCICIQTQIAVGLLGFAVLASAPALRECPLTLLQCGFCKVKASQ